MITFILGEDRHVKYFVHSVDQYDYFAIKEANFSLLHNGKEEAAGVCTIERDEEKNGYYVDTKILDQIHRNTTKKWDVLSLQQK